MQHSDSIAKLAIALSKAQADMPRVAFDSVNPFLKNQYASLGAMIEASRPILARNDLAVAQIVTSCEFRVGVETVLMHSSGEWISSTIDLPVVDEKGKSGAQAAGSIITYLRRYSYAAILGLYADEDTDGNASQAAQAKPSKPAAQKPQPQAEQPAGENGGGQDSPFPPGEKKLSDMDGKELYAIQKTAPDALGLNSKHFENRWKKRFNARSLKEIPVTLAEFMRVMAEEDTEPEEAKAA